MKNERKILVVGLVFAMVAAFSIGSANAAWMNSATIDNIQATPDGNYLVRATSGSWSQTFTIVSTDANSNAMLAVALTALASDKTIKIEFTGSTIIRLIILN